MTKIIYNALYRYLQIYNEMFFQFSSNAIFKNLQRQEMLINRNSIKTDKSYSNLFVDKQVIENSERFLKNISQYPKDTPKFITSYLKSVAFESLTDLKYLKNFNRI